MNNSIASTKGLRLLLLVSLFALASCSDDDESIYPTITLEYPALYFAAPSDTQTMGVSTSQAVSASVSSYPTGWTVAVDIHAGTVTVTSPAADEEDAEESGTASIVAYSSTGHSSYATLFLSCETPEPLDEQRSNCYVVTEPGKSYSIPIDRKGESDQPLTPASVGIVWQSPGSTVLYPRMEGSDRMSFYIPTDDDGAIVPGNALFAAYDGNGEVLWTWHLWATPTEPEAEGAWMDRNLGAAYAAYETQTEILRSYGPYYQWGRMTPFVGPYSYNCAASADAYMYDASSTLVYLSYEETSAETGTTAYALSHPLVYLLGTEESDYDWNFTHDAGLWTAAEKSIYDPCPKGWRVAKSFAGWQIGDDLSAGTATYAEQFGWHLTDGTESLFFLGGGRRSWLNGLITNVNTNETPKPWIGYYWTAAAGAENLSEALYFNLDTEDSTLSEIDTELETHRANGMQIRCVKDE